MGIKTNPGFDREWVGPIELNDLPKYSSWPLHLLNLSDFTERRRSNEYVLREYGERWGKIHQSLKSNEFADLGETFDYIMHNHYKSDMLFHINENIYYTKNSLGFKDYVNRKTADILSMYMASDDTLVELGSGWGRNLFYFLHNKLCSKIIGGEYSEEGLATADFISKKFGLPAEFFHFDYYNPQPQFMQKLTNNVVFTHNSVEQISCISEETILALIESRPRTVIHFEPVYEYRNKNTLLHCLWRRYTQINDYNRNLLTVLRKFASCGRLRIIAEQIHSMGLNAFNPGSFIIWEPSG